MLRGIGREVSDNADIVGAIAAAQIGERAEMAKWLAQKRANLQAVDPGIDAVAAVALHAAEGMAWLRQLDDISEFAGLKPSTPPKPDALTLDTLMERWRREREPAPGTVLECEFAVRRFRELHGPLPVADITSQHVREFREAMLRLPSTLSNGEARLPLPEILRRFNGQDLPRSTPVTARKKLSFLKTLLNLAVDAGDLQESPAAGIRIADVERRQRHPFSARDLTAIFTRPPFVAGGERGSAFWLMLLGLHTGARLGELLQLMPGDVQAPDGIDFIDITNEGGRRLKTDGSRRRVPVQPQLAALGFLDWAKAKDGGLFAELLPDGGQLSKNASRILNRLIRAAGVKDELKAFHSFRHSFKDACREAGVEEAIGDALTGHAGGGVGRRYGAGFPLKVLAEAFGKLRWPVDLTHLMP